jgi:hypothetical protein
MEWPVRTLVGTQLAEAKSFYDDIPPPGTSPDPQATPIPTNSHQPKLAVVNSRIQHFAYKMLHPDPLSTTVKPRQNRETENLWYPFTRPPDIYPHLDLATAKNRPHKCHNNKHIQRPRSALDRSPHQYLCNSQLILHLYASRAGLSARREIEMLKVANSLKMSATAVSRLTPLFSI